MLYCLFIALLGDAVKVLYKYFVVLIIVIGLMSCINVARMSTTLMCINTTGLKKLRLLVHGRRLISRDFRLGQPRI